MADHRIFDLYGILLDPDEQNVLMLRESENWTLPHIRQQENVKLDALCDGMGKLLAADLTVLRRVFGRYSEDGSHGDLIYRFESHRDGWTLPTGATWINRQELEKLPLATPGYRGILAAVLLEAETNDIPKDRQPWAYPGWFKHASAWMTEALTSRGYTLTAPIHQVKSWGISCVLSASTDRGRVFFKVSAALPLFGNEPALMQALSERFPDYVPAPIAIQPAERWMLLEDFGPELVSMPTVERWKLAVERFARLQIDSLGRLDELLALGCLDRRLEVLAAQIDPLVNDQEALARMTPDEMAQVRSLAPRWKEMCRVLASYGVPHSLDHGDFHGGNITGQTLQFFDWTDACIAHPFLDLSTAVMDMEFSLTPDERAQVVETYLSMWLSYEPLDRLRQMWRLAEPLGALHQAISYQHIVASIEPASKPQLSDLPLWMRRLIRMTPG